MATWKQLDIYVKESDRWQQKRLWLVLIEADQQQKMAGATVTRSLTGLGRNRAYDATGVLALSTDPAIVVTVIDSEEAIARFWLIIQEMI